VRWQPFFVLWGLQCLGASKQGREIGFPLSLQEQTKKRVEQKPKNTRSRNSQKQTNPKLCNLQTNNKKYTKPESPKNTSRQTWKKES